MIVVTFAASLTGAAFGQEPSPSAPADTTARGALPFRRNQWGADITLFTGSAVGILRFRAPNRAWLLDVAISGNVSSTSRTDGYGFGSGTAGGVSARARVGRRTYRSLLPRAGGASARAAAFATVGGSVSGGWAHTEYGSRFGGGAVGAFVEVGGTAFITDYLALNASVDAVLEGRYDSTSNERPDGGRDKTIQRLVHAGAGGIRVFGSVFF